MSKVASTFDFVASVHWALAMTVTVVAHFTSVSLNLCTYFFVAEAVFQSDLFPCSESDVAVTVYAGSQPMLLNCSVKKLVPEPELSAGISFVHIFHTDVVSFSTYVLLIVRSGFRNFSYLILEIFLQLSTKLSNISLFFCSYVRHQLF